MICPNTHKQTQEDKYLKLVAIEMEIVIDAPGYRVLECPRCKYRVVES